MIQTAPLQCRIEPTYFERKYGEPRTVVDRYCFSCKADYHPCLVCILFYILYFVFFVDPVCVHRYTKLILCHTGIQRYNVMKLYNNKSASSRVLI